MTQTKIVRQPVRRRLGDAGTVIKAQRFALTCGHEEVVPYAVLGEEWPFELPCYVCTARRIRQ